MTVRITKRVVDGAQAGEAIWDSEIRGFGLRVSRGGAKSYVLKYRVDGVQRWMTIGRHGSPWTPDAARKRAREALAGVARGEDPAAEKAALRKGETVSQFAERFLADYVRVRKKPRSAAEDERLLRRVILPALGGKKVATITRSEIAAFHRSLKNTPYQANPMPCAAVCHDARRRDMG